MTDPVVGYLAFYSFVAFFAYVGALLWRFLQTFWDGEGASPARWALTFIAPAVWPITLVVAIIYTVYVSTKEYRND